MIQAYRWEVSSRVHPREKEGVRKAYVAALRSLAADLEMEQDTPLPRVILGAFHVEPAHDYGYLILTAFGGD